MVGSLTIFSGCAWIDSDNIVTTTDIDPAGGLSRADYLALRQRNPPEEPAAKKNDLPPPIPTLPEGSIESPAVVVAMDKHISLTVTDSVPVRDVLMELVRKTGANLELDPRVQGSVIITAHDQSFEQVLKRICASAGLRYTVDGNFIHIEPDDPYQKNYQLDYLSLARHATSETGIATNVFDVDVGTNTGSIGTSSGSGSNGASATQNNSTAKVSSASDADFWAETEKLTTLV